MNKSEFRRWLNHHVTRFPAVGSWLQKYPTTERGGPFTPTQQAITDGWFNVLSLCNINDAIQASDRIHSGLAAGPESFDTWPAAIASLCRVERSRRMDSAASERYRPAWKPRCETCRDEGVRFGVMPKTLDEAVENTTLFHESGTIYECVYACDRCDKGRVRSEQQSGEKRRVLLRQWRDGMIDATSYEWVKANYQERRAIVIEWAMEQSRGTDFTQQFD